MMHHVHAPCGEAVVMGSCVGHVSSLEIAVNYCRPWWEVSVVVVVSRACARCGEALVMDSCVGHVSSPEIAVNYCRPW